MRKYLYIMTGGMLGAVLRVLIKNISYNTEWSPLFATLAVNVTGSFLLSLVLGAASGLLEIDKSLRIGITAGFLGALTTFSAVCRETADLMTGGGYIMAVLYIVLSATLGMAAVYAGNGLITKVFKFCSKSGSGVEEKRGVE